MSLKRALIAACLLALGACSTTQAEPPVGCQSDDECEGDQLCFAEGCGDPGAGVAVEVSGGALSSHALQDFALVDGSLSRAQDFDLGSALGINGSFQRESSSLDRSPYTESVTVRAVGKSLLLPGISRTFETTIDRPERGFFEFKLASGEYTLTAVPNDRLIPPLALAEAVRPASPAATVSVVFAGREGTSSLSGQIIKTTDSRLLPPEPVLLRSAYESGEVPVVDVQLFDVSTNEPLSQRFQISSENGWFEMAVSPEARSRSSLMLVAAPRDTGAPIPTKRFTINTPLPPAISLEYGDFGEPGVVTGSIVDSQGAPVANAQVLLDGTVRGDGTFRSRVAVTDAQGQFSLTSLPSRGEGTFTMYVAPSRASRSAVTRVAATVKVENGVATLSPSTVKLNDRLIARGQVLRPGSTVGAGNVAVRATMQNVTSDTVGASPLAIEPAEAMTEADGSFTMPLDEGVWRFEYFPGEQTPLSSRLLTIKAERDLNGMPVPELQLRSVQLSKGRTVSGVVTATTGTRTGLPVPYSQLRFFRVTKVEGKDTSILLGTAVADERGMYRVTLPSVSTAAQ